MFISHSARDTRRVRRLRERLRSYGVTSVFLDFDPEEGIPAGAKWEFELSARLRQCDAVLFVGTRASVESKWCFAELAMARSLGKAIIPVTVERGGRHPLLADTQAVDCAGFDDTGFNRLAERLAVADLDPARSFAWDISRSPFPGLAAFEELDAAVYFGRQADVEKLLEYLRLGERSYSGRLFAVLGPSGSGKSSLIRAGVVPRLRREDPPWIIVPAVRPGDRPVHHLARALEQAFHACDGERSVIKIERALDRGAPALIELAEDLCRLHARPDPSHNAQSVLVFVDQAEELVVLGESSERERFMSLLHGATRASGPLSVVLTFRAEFLSELLRAPAGTELIDDQLLIGPLPSSRIAEVIERPAERAAIDFEPGLVGRMVGDAGGGDALPLLAHTLAELHRRAKRAGRRTVTHEDYDDLGGVVGAIQRSADREQERLARRGHEDVVATLVKLVTIGPEGLPTRRRLPCAALTDQEREVVDAFVAARLLTSGEPDGRPTVEVAHEALLRQWRPLEFAIEEHHDELQIRSEIERSTQDWLRSGHRPEYLFTGQRLDKAARLLGASAADGGRSALSKEELQFLTVSERRRDRETSSARWKARSALAQRLVVASAFALICAFAVSQLVNAINKQKVAEAVTMAGSALADLAADSGDGAGSSLRAFEISRTPFTESALRLAASQTLPQVTVDTGALDAIALSRDGRHLAGVTADGGVQVWSLRDPPDAEPVVLAEPEEGIEAVDRMLAPASVAFDDDGRRVAVVEGPGDVHIYDRLTRRVIDLGLGDPRNGPDLEGADVDDLAIEATGRSLVLTNGASVIVWDVDRPEAVADFIDAPGSGAAAFDLARNGRLVASVDDHGTARVWSWRAPHRATILPNQPTPATRIAIAPDGNRIATADADGAIRVWDLTQADVRPSVVHGPARSISALGFLSPTRIAVADQERGNVTVLGWKQPRDSRVVTHGYLAATDSLAFGPAQVAAAAYDDTVRILEWHEPLAHRIRGDGAATAISADGRHVATAAEEGAVRVWETRAPGDPPTRLRGGVAPVAALAFAPDGDHIAAAATGDGPGQGGANVWDRRAPGDAPAVVRETIYAIAAVGFSDQGRDVVVAEDLALSVWDWQQHDTSFDGLRRDRSFPAYADEDSRVTMAAVARHGRYVARAWSNGQLSVYDVRRESDTSVPTRSGADITALAFDRHGRRLATAFRDGTVTAWDWRTRTGATVLSRHTAVVTALAFAPDEHTLASGDKNGNVRISDWATPSAPPTVVPRSTSGISAMAFTRDGRHLYTVDDNWTIRALSCLRCGDIDALRKIVRDRAPYSPSP